MTNWRRLLPYLKPHRGDFKTASFSMIVVAILSSVSIGLLKKVIDQAFVLHNLAMLKQLALLIPLLFLIKSVFSYLLNYKLAKIGHAIAKTLRDEATAKLLALDHGYHSQRTSTDHLARLTSDIANIANMVTNTPLYVIRDGLTVTFLLAFIFYLNARFASVLILTIPIFAAIFLAFTFKLKRITKTAQELISELYQLIGEGLSGLSAIKTYLYEEPWLKRFKEKNDAHLKAMLKFQKVTAFSPALMEFLSGIVIALVLFWGGLEVLQGRWSAGAFMAFLGAAFAAYQPIKHLTQVNPIIQMGLTSYKRILEIEDAPIQIHTQNFDHRERPVFNNAIVFDNVSFAYPDGRKALDQISLTIKKGEILGLAGASGSGKTSLAMLLARFYDPSEGTIFIDGVNVKTIDPKDLRKNIALVTQEAFLFADSIYANIAMGRPLASAQEIEEAARVAHVLEFASRLPQGLATHAGERGQRFSSGQKQRIALARAILKKAPLLILDEATSNLDPESEELVLDAVGQMLKGRTAIVISHRIGALADTKRIVVMEKGKIIEETSFEDLQRGEAKYLGNLMRL